MKCQLVYLGPTAEGRHQHRCTNCGEKIVLSQADPATITRECPRHRPRSAEPPPSDGPGSELRGLTKELDLQEKPGCGCAELAAAMNALGVEGCRRQRLQLAQQLKDKAHKWGLGEKAWAAIRAARSGLALRLDWSDPYLGLVDEAIRRAELKEGNALAALTLAQIPLLDRVRIAPEQLLKSRHQFNNSLIRFEGRLLMAYRLHWLDSEIVLAELDEHFQVLANHRLRLAGHAHEDPRLFVFGGELHVSFTAPERHGRFYAGSRVGYARLEEVGGTWRVAQQWLLPSPLASPWEKNWGFFEHGGELLAVYSLSPHRVARIRGDRVAIVWDVACDFEGKGGLLHGGAAPVLHQGEYYSFYHRIVGPGTERRYSVDLYTFEAQPPFRPARHIFDSLLTATPADRPAAAIPHCVFPGGAVRDGWGSWFVGFGYYDTWSEIGRWNEWELEHALTPLRGGPFGGLAFRHEDAGLLVWKQVVLGNEYRLPADLSGQTIVDVGQHIGSFSQACLMRGAARVIGIEPMAASRACAAKNLARWGSRCETIAAYVVGDEGLALGDHYPQPLVPDPTAARLSLDKLLTGLPPVDLLKLDCEGPEHAIADRTDLSRVQRIVGEIHQLGDRNAATFAAALCRQGFRITISPAGAGLWHFWAER